MTDPTPTRRAAAADAPPDDRLRRVLATVLGGSLMISLLAVLLAMVAGGLLIAATDADVQTAAGYFTARPGDTFSAAWEAVSGSYVALFHGAVLDPDQASLVDQVRPFCNTLGYAAPLIAAGLGVGLAFRAGMFNIGGQGQMLIAAGCAGWVGFSLDLPVGVHLVLALAAGIVGGALWGGLVGLLKAKTGAHEVILTIMLNYVAFYLISYLLRTPVLQAPGSPNPISSGTAPSATLPDLFGAGVGLNASLLLALAAALLVGWVLTRSSLGFRFRSVGLNPHAARVAGIDVKSTYVVVMLWSGGLLGLAGAFQVLGTVTTGFSSGIDAGIGFSAITVALRGRSRPSGIVVAGILFGAFKSGGFAMQAAEGVPVDIVVVVQSLIVLFVAAPRLVQEMFHLPAPPGRAAAAPVTPTVQPTTEASVA